MNQKIAAQNSEDFFNLEVSLDNNFTALNNDAARTTNHTNNKQYLMLGDNAGLINFTNPVHIDGYKSVSWLYWKVHKKNFTQNVVLKLDNGQVGTHLLKSTTSDFSSNVTDLGEFSSRILTNVSLSDGDYLAIAKVGIDPTLSGFEDETKTYGDPDFTLTAPTSNASGAFTYFSADTSIASVVSTTGVVTLHGAGSVVLTARQASDGTYNMATVTKTLTVLKKGISASGITALDKIYDGTTSATVDVSGLSFSGLVGSDVVTVTSVGVFDTKNVGTNKTVTLTNTYGGADIGNYNITDQTTTTASITAKTLTVTAIDKSKAYDGAIYSGGYSVTYSGFVTGDSPGVLSGTVTYTGSAITATSVGSYPIVPSGYSASNYTILYVSGTLSITKAGLSISGIKANDKVYDGTTSATVDLSGISYTGLVSGDSITVTSTAVFDTKNVGTGKTVTLTNTYGGNAANYTITDQTTTTASITAKTLTITAIDKSKTYDGAIYSGGYSVTYAGFISGENASVLAGTVTYTGSAITAINAGSYTISPSGYTATNYSIVNVSGTLTISKAGINASGITAEDKVYDGTTSATVDVSGLSFSGIVGSDVVTVTSVGVFDTKNVGTNKTVTLTNTYGGADIGNYTITDQTTTTASITAKTLTITTSDGTKVFDGTPFSTFSVTYTGFVSGEDASILNGTLTYTGTALTQFDVGTYSATASGYSATNYSIQYVTGTISITKAGLSISGIKAYDKVYDGTTSATVDLSGISYSGLAFGDSITVTSTAVFDNKNVGTGKTVTLTNTYGGDATNYTITDQTTTTASITAKTLSVTASSVSKTYDGAIYSGGYSVTYDGFVSGDDASLLSGTVTYTGSAIAATSVGSYTISPSGYTATNYSIANVSGTLTISKAGLTVSKITAEDKVYDGTTSATVNTSSISYTGLISGDSITVTSTAVFDTKNVGTGKTVTLTNTYGGDATNYTITDQTTTTASITAKTLTITAIDKSKTYDGAIYSGGYSVTYTGFVSGENASVLAGTVTYTGAALTATDVGTYSVTPDGYISTNYTLLFESGTLSITKAGLTVSGIKANDKVYDGTTSATVNLSGISYLGLASGDSITVNSTGVFDTKNVGTGKTITLTNTYGGDATNYTITDQTTTTASITTKELVVTAVNVTRVYDGSKYSGFTVNYNSFASGESVSDLSGTLSFTGAGVDAVAIGSYSFTAQGLSSSNYNISYVVGSHIIKDPAEIPPGSTIYIIPTASQSKTYGATNPTLTYSTSPTVTLTGTLSRVTGENIGTYSITLGTVTSSVYTLVLNPEVFTIHKKTITTTGIKAADKVYDTTTSATVTTSSVVFVGLVGSDVVTVTSSGVFDNKNVGVGKTVALTNTYGGADLSKYTVVDQTSTTATITAATMTVTNITAYDKVYDGTKTARLNSSSMSYTGLLAGDTVGITPVGTFVNKHVGTNKIINLSYTFSVTANYRISYQATSTASITPATLSVTTVDATKTYDGSVYSGFAVSFNGFQGTDSVVDLPGTLSFTGSGTTATEVGVYSVTATGYTSTNYNLHFIAGTLTINAAPPITTVRVIPSASQSKTYGETEPVFTYTTEPDTELEGTLSRVAGEAAGTYQFTLGSLSHSSYSLAIDAVDFTINPRTIIVSGIRAKDKIYDGTTSALVDTSSVVFKGLLPGDTASVVSSGVFEDETIGTDKTVYLTNTYTLSAASSYLIVDQTSCTASITSIPIYVIPDADQFKVYGSSYPIYSYTTSPTTVLTGVLGREIGSDVGTYSYTLGTLESPSHSELILVNDFFTILKKDLEITANDDYFRYDYSNQPYWGGNGIQVKGFVYGENLLQLNGSLKYSGSSQGAFEVGIYDIVPGGLQSDNYEITYKKGLLTIDDPDTDGDGIIDSIDEDDDGDGQLDVHELSCGSNPLDFLSLSLDRDGDQLPDCLDTIDDKFAISGVITPRSSGMEATWKIVNLEFYPNHHIRVFNQNKKLVFETTHYQNDWSGTYLNNSKSLPANAYYFIVNLNNGEEPYTGWVYITY